MVKRLAYPTTEEIEFWLAEVPNGGERREWERRLSDRDQGNRVGALLELILHQFFQERGYRVRRHPILSGTSRSLDYLVQRKECSFYLEAIALVNSEAEELSRGGVVWSGQDTTLFHKVSSKATRYGSIDKPYVVAVWCPANPTDEQVELNFLFGTLAVQYELLTHVGQKANPPTEVRKEDGLFMSYCLVSAVVVYEYVYLNGGKSHQFRVYHNPWANLPLGRSVFAEYPQTRARKQTDGRWRIETEQP